MTPEQQLANVEKALFMVKQLDGRAPMLMLGYDFDTHECRVLIHPGLRPVIADAARRKSFFEQIMDVLDTASHPENLHFIREGDPPPVPNPPVDLERMMGDEGGEG